MCCKSVTNTSYQQQRDTIYFSTESGEKDVRKIPEADCTTGEFNLKPFPKQALDFTCLQYRSFENTVGKGEIAHNKQFLLFPQCFLPVWRTFCHLHQIQNCRQQTLSVRKSLKFAVWERVNLPNDSEFSWLWQKKLSKTLWEEEKMSVKM